MKLKHLEKYKEPTQLNGTDYYRFPSNKVEDILQKAREEERERIVEILSNLVPKDEDAMDVINDWIVPELKRAIHPELDHPILEDNKSNYELLGNRTVEEYCEHIKDITHPTKQTED